MGQQHLAWLGSSVESPRPDRVEERKRRHRLCWSSMRMQDWAVDDAKYILGEFSPISYTAFPSQT